MQGTLMIRPIRDEHTTTAKRSEQKGDLRHFFRLM